MGHAVKNSIAPSHLDVFGIAMNSSMDYREIRGVKGIDEPCLRGYDRSFEALDIVIGYGIDGKIRKITTRNSHNSMFGVHPGEAVATALVKIRSAGFVANGSPYYFKKENLALSLLVDGGGRLFGITIENLVS
jgi:hypothetical protein